MNDPTNFECPYLKLFYNQKKEDYPEVFNEEGEEDLEGSFSKTKEKVTDLSARYEIIN